MQSAPRSTGPDVESAPDRKRLDTSTFSFTGAVTARSVDRLSAFLEPYVEYLRELGQAPDDSLPTIFLDPDKSPARARAAHADRENGRLVIGLAVVELPDIVLHEYTHYVLEGTASIPRRQWPAGASTLEAGIAFYLPCSHRDNPLQAGTYDLRTLQRPAPPWLDQAHRDGLTWATSMWQIRTDLGAETVDRLLLETWRFTAALPTGPSDEAFVEHFDRFLPGNAPGEGLRTQLIEHGARLPRTEHGQA